MNVVAIRPQPIVARSLRASDRRIERVEIFDDLTLAEPHWRALEQVDSLATPYQKIFLGTLNLCSAGCDLLVPR